MPYPVFSQDRDEHHTTQGNQIVAIPQSGNIAFDIDARQAQVVGDAPRIEPIPNEEVEGHARDLSNQVRRSAGSQGGYTVHEYMRVMMKHPAIFRCQMQMGDAIYNGVIPARERELAVLRIGWVSRAPYEWGEHVRIAKISGVTPEEIERVTAGSSAQGWSAHEAALLRGVEEIIADQTVSDATWETLAESWNEPQLIEYLMMVGQYLATACLQNSLRIRLTADNPGLRRR